MAASCQTSGVSSQALMLVVEAEKISERGEGRGGEREWERRTREWERRTRKRERRWEAWGRVDDGGVD